MTMQSCGAPNRCLLPMSLIQGRCKADRIDAPHTNAAELLLANLLQQILICYTIINSISGSGRKRPESKDCHFESYLIVFLDRYLIASRRFWLLSG